MDNIIHKSGLLKKEALLLNPFIKEPWKEFTLSGIKTLSKNSSHHYVYEALEKFCKLNILNKTEKGKTNIYCLSCNDESIDVLSFIEAIIKDERKDISYKNIHSITKKLKSKYYSLLITGSYADKKQKSSSDIDVIIIIPNNESKKQFEIALKEGELSIPEVHGFVFTQNEFYSMLINDEFNLGKETAKKHIIIYGAEAYYGILFEAIKNGFNNRYVFEKSKK